MEKLLCGLVVAAMALLTRPGFAADDWLKDEVLKQLSELRQDNAKLHGEVDALRQQLAETDKGKTGKLSKPLAELIGGRAVLGNAKAKVIVAEFTDFECPFCKKFSLATFPEFKQRYVDAGKVQYVLRDFPLSFHAQAQAAAIAARCAGQQNAYWGMKQKLFENQARLGRELFLSVGGELKLDGGKFQACLDNPVMAESVAKDVAYGNQAGIQATPTFLIGRIEGGQVKDIKAVSGAIAFLPLSQMIDALAKAP
jgi:protein-disulfide isomerase